MNMDAIPLQPSPMEPQTVAHTPMLPTSGLLTTLLSPDATMMPLTVAPSSILFPPSTMSQPELSVAPMMMSSSAITPSTVVQPAPSVQPTALSVQPTAPSVIQHSTPLIMHTTALPPAAGLQHHAGLTVPRTYNIQDVSNTLTTMQTQSAEVALQAGIQRSPPLLQTVNGFPTESDTVLVMQQDRNTGYIEYNTMSQVQQNIVDKPPDDSEIPQQAPTPVYAQSVVDNASNEPQTSDRGDPDEKEYEALLFKVKSLHNQMMKRFQRSPDVYRPALERYLSQSGKLCTAESLSYALSTFGRATPREVLLNKYEHTESKRQMLDVHRFMKKHQQSENKLKLEAIEKEQAQERVNRQKRGKRTKAKSKTMKIKLENDPLPSMEEDSMLSDEKPDFLLDPIDGTTSVNQKDHLDI